MFDGFQKVYLAFVEHPFAATSALFAAAFAYERFRNARLTQTIIDLGSSQVKAVANLEVALTSFKDTIITGLLKR